MANFLNGLENFAPNFVGMWQSLLRLGTVIG